MNPSEDPPNLTGEIKDVVQFLISPKLHQKLILQAVEKSKGENNIEYHLSTMTKPMRFLFGARSGMISLTQIFGEIPEIFNKENFAGDVYPPRLKNGTKVIYKKASLTDSIQEQLIDLKIAYAIDRSKKGTETASIVYMVGGLAGDFKNMISSFFVMLFLIVISLLK